MTPRNRAILIVGLALLLVLGLIFGILMLVRTVAPPPAEVPSGQEVPPVTEPESVKVTGFENPLILEAPPVQGRTASQQMAELFAERYGSYSNQGDYQNLRDLLPVMTSSYRRSTETFLETAPSTPGATYEGVTSVKVSSDVRSMDASSAVIAVTLQQSKTVGSGAPVIGYRTLRMELMKSGDEWRVDKAAWED